MRMGLNYSHMTHMRFLIQQVCKKIIYKLLFLNSITIGSLVMNPDYFFYPSLDLIYLIVKLIYNYFRIVNLF